MCRALLFLIFTLALCSCAEKSKTVEKELKLSPAVESLYKLVVAKHDEVMPKISDISKLSTLLRSDMENMGDDKESKERKEKILELLTALQSAHDAMFDWMGEFKSTITNADFYKKSKEKELLEYLKSEEIKIDRVAKVMLESIGNAEVFIKK
jgi:hypothetical protein